MALPTRTAAHFARTDAMAVRRAFPVTPHPTNALQLPTRRVYLGVAGDLECTFIDDPRCIVLLVNLAAGIWHELCLVRVLAARTTALNIVGGV